MTYRADLFKYFGNNVTLIHSFAVIFDSIKTLSGVIFDGLDGEMFTEMGNEFYFGNCHRELKNLYKAYLSELDLTDEEAISTFMNHVAETAYLHYGRNWETLYKSYFLTDYNPLENYDMEQVRTPELDTKNTTSRKTKTDVTTTGSSSIVPFNETTPTLVSESSGESETLEAKNDNEVESNLEERGKDTLTRHGNIGVTTSQQMLQSEIDLRRFDFVKRLYKDIGSLMFRDYWKW